MEPLGVSRILSLERMYGLLLHACGRGHSGQRAGPRLEVPRSGRSHRRREAVAPLGGPARLDVAELRTLFERLRERQAQGRPAASKPR